MPFVYVLRSPATGRYYTGATLNLEARLQQHNADQSISTKNRGPWDLVHHEEYSTLAEALRRERFLKTGKGRQEFKRLLAPKDGSAG
jgi:putative endonuclease